MGYAPFKMHGHELPGIKQRPAPGKALEVDPLNAEMVDGVSKKSGTLYTEGGVGSSPGKLFSKIRDSIKRLTKPAEAVPDQTAPTPITPQSNAARLDALESASGIQPDSATGVVDNTAVDTMEEVAPVGQQVANTPQFGVM